MTPIVSPFFIYMLGVIQEVNIWVAIIATFAGLLAIASIIGWHAVKSDDYLDDDWLPIWKKIGKITVPTFIIALFLSLAVPSKNTLIAIYVTKFVTTDNIVKAVEVGGEFKDTIKGDIIELIEAMKGEKDE